MDNTESLLRQILKEKKWNPDTDGERRRMDDELHGIDLKLVHITSEIASINRQLSNMCEMCKKHSLVIYGDGNGNKGLVTKTQQLMDWKGGSGFWRGVILSIAICVLGMGFSFFKYSTEREKAVGRLEKTVAVNERIIQRMLNNYEHIDIDRHNQTKEI